MARHALLEQTGRTAQGERLQSGGFEHNLWGGVIVTGHPHDHVRADR